MSGLAFWFVVYLVVMIVTLVLVTALMGGGRDDNVVKTRPSSANEPSDLSRAHMPKASRSSV